MPRSGRLRTFIREYRESHKTEKLSFIPPFLILIVEAILLLHALTIDVPDIMVVELTTILLIISIIEIFLVGQEIHEHFTKNNFDRILTIKLDDFITETKEKNVKTIVTNFIEENPKYNSNRNEIYHIACQILETHYEEEIEKELTNKLKKFVKQNKDLNVDEIVENFAKIYPQYKRYRSEIYTKSCMLLAKN
jgi:hypothetical protein